MKARRDVFVCICFRGYCTILTLTETLLRFFGPLKKIFSQKETLPAMFPVVPHFRNIRIATVHRNRDNNGE